LSNPFLSQAKYRQQRRQRMTGVKICAGE